MESPGLQDENFSITGIFLLISGQSFNQKQRTKMWFYLQGRAILGGIQ